VLLIKIVFDVRQYVKEKKIDKEKDDLDPGEFVP
jgi:hypothetical protein